MKPTVFIERLKLVAKRPGMFMVHRVEDVVLIIEGYQLAIAGEGKNDAVAVSEFMNGFADFVNHYFQSEKDFMWWVCIRLNSRDDKHSLALFAEMFDAYALQQETAD